ncbi:hypothetical protein SLEP1_g19526 [Rubroshorea leprosula]|uniref:NAC domain-containing protein n=1 Tax=Rubroshorea leprosula TaxID=152421 RepID=A0AAV5J8W4_9ROSI|nr:hypothetical protein SLEP1_g19526 [Rubroshorea leprosula]
MARSWNVDGRAIAKKVRNASVSSVLHIEGCGAHSECPSCHCRIDNSDVSLEWDGLPAGVKFDPSDVELVGHLAAKCGTGTSKPHILIDEFIPTLEENQGICYTHPENLPGAKKDGSSIHFFHKTINAYATGQRKRRKIHNQHDENQEDVRWHKTGKTKLVIDNGVEKGWKKIMVLYKSSKKGSKPDKSNWVMHQYHLGKDEEERGGEFVVSKIFYQQPKQTDKNDEFPVKEEQDNLNLHTSPRTPKTIPPNPPRSGKSVMDDDVTDDNTIMSSPQEPKFDGQAYCVQPPSAQPEDDIEYSTCLAGESQAAVNPAMTSIDDSLLSEIFNASSLVNNSGKNNVPETGHSLGSNEVTRNNDASYDLSDSELAKLGLLDIPLGIEVPDWPFGSQDSNHSWWDRP